MGRNNIVSVFFEDFIEFVSRSIPSIHFCSHATFSFLSFHMGSQIELNQLKKLFNPVILSLFIYHARSYKVRLVLIRKVVEEKIMRNHKFESLINILIKSTINIS